MKTFQQFIEEKNACLDEGVGKYTVTRHEKTKDFTIYHIMKGGERVGSLKQHRDSGSITGKLHGKDLDDIGGGKYTGSGALGKLHAFLKSKKGQKFNENVSEQFIAEKVDPADKVLKALERTKVRLEKLVDRNVGINTKAAYDAQDKYKELTKEAEELGVWDRFCKKYKFHPHHDARDYWA